MICAGYNQDFYPTCCDFLTPLPGIGDIMFRTRFIKT